MKPNKRDPQLFLEDMAFAMQRVLEYVDGLDFQEFKWDYKTVDAVVRNFEIIGEASKNVPEGVKEKYPAIPWEEMYRLRNRVAHACFQIDYEILWEISTRYLPQNHADILLVIQAEKM
ncbi:MAG: DUF86 domain-containing protein [Bacteroidia bacterium]